MLVEGARRIRRNTQKGERWGVLLKEIARNYPEIIDGFIWKEITRNYPEILILAR